MSWGNPRTVQDKLARSFLLPASGFYNLGLQARSLSYDSGILKREKVAAQVISIGNITCGGTGKTPVTINLAKRLIEGGRRVAIVSRGYRRRSKDACLVVSDGQKILANCSDAGDEPFMMAKNVPGACVIVSSSRVQAATLACEKYGCNTILLDDGFQHWRLSRDQDIVLIDYNDNPENDALLPAGRLRESLSALSRADIIIISKVPANYDQAKLDSLKKTISKYAPQAKITQCQFQANALVKIESQSNNNHPQDKAELFSLKGKKVIGVCGIAKPEPFFDMLETAGCQLVQRHAFGDHHWYSQQDIDTIGQSLAQRQAECIVTTEKDAVRLSELAIDNLPIYYIGLETKWLGAIPAIA
jgi:tetraacyldisaccharide 4'-kinase